MMTHSNTRIDELVLVGASHQTASLGLLESICLDPAQVRDSLHEIKQLTNAYEVIALSTCNRTEVYAVGADGKAIQEQVKNWFITKSSLENSHLVGRGGKDAVNHLFKLACGLDSMILGETEISGQIQRAFEVARRENTAGGFFTQLFSSAFKTSKRARNETEIGEGTTSVASASVHLARRIFGDLSRRSVLVVGAGETGTLVGKYFKQHNPKQLIIANRTRANAQLLAESLEAGVADLNQLENLLSTVDIVVCATHCKQPLVTEAMVRNATPRTMQLLVDISLPHNVEAGASKVDNVFLYDMTDLQSMVEKNLLRRVEHIGAVEKIIENETMIFFRQQATMEVGPLIRDLRHSFETLRKQELERFASKFSEKDRPIVERLTRDLINKLLHKPTLKIRDFGRELDGDSTGDFVRALFGLETPEE